MNIIVVGAGVVGTSVAEQLSLEGHSVAIVERDRAIVKELNDSLDVMAVAGDGSSASVLESVGIRNASMLIAATDHDEINIVVGMLAARFGVEHRIVRARNPEFAVDNPVMPLRDFGIDHVVNPDPFIVESLLRMVELPGAYDYATLAAGQVDMFGFRVAPDSPMIGRSLSEIRELGALNAFLVLYISRNNTTIVPRGDDVIQEGDSIHMLISSETTAFIRPIVHPHDTPADRIVVVGATRIGIHLAERLEAAKKRVILIEPNPALAREAASVLQRSIVLAGEPTDLAVLREAAIDECDMFCATTDDDKVNMMAALLAKKNCAAHTAALVRHPDYVAVLDSLGIDIVINPRLAIVGEILQHVRRGHVNSVTRVADAPGEIIEFLVGRGCKAAATPLRRLKFPKGALVGAVVTEDGMQIPDGNTHLKEGDRVLVYTLPQAVQRIEVLFAH